MPKPTVGELLHILNYHSTYRSKSGDNAVIIKFNQPFFEMYKQQHDELKEAVSKKLALIAAGVDEPDPITTFALQLLAETH